MRINQAFIHGFMGNSYRVTNALTIVGDSESIRITKCEAFDEWLSDNTKIIDHDGVETTYSAANREMLRRVVMAWLDDVEFDG